ncbi:MAG: hypothetical protein WAX69_15305 [Victivallales bacterium]
MKNLNWRIKSIVNEESGMVLTETCTVDTKDAMTEAIRGFTLKYLKEARPDGYRLMRFICGDKPNGKSLLTAIWRKDKNGVDHG